MSNLQECVAAHACCKPRMHSNVVVPLRPQRVQASWVWRGSPQVSGKAVPCLLTLIASRPGQNRWQQSSLRTQARLEAHPAGSHQAIRLALALPLQAPEAQVDRLPVALPERLLLHWPGSGEWAPDLSPRRKDHVRWVSR